MRRRRSASDGAAERIKRSMTHVALARTHARRYRHDGRARGSGARGGLLGAAAGQLSRCGRARRRSPRATSRRWRRFTTFRPGARPAITGEMRWRCSSPAPARRITSRCMPAIPTIPTAAAARIPGHTFICGPTGSGKTVFIGFLVAMLARQGATQVLFDKDRGLEILVRALGGMYLPLETACRPASIRCSCRRRRRTSSS